MLRLTGMGRGMGLPYPLRHASLPECPHFHHSVTSSVSLLLIMSFSGDFCHQHHHQQCFSLLKWESEVLVAQPCLTLQPHGLEPARFLCSRGFSRQESWSVLLFLSPGDLPNPGIKPQFSTLQVNSLPSEPSGKPTRKLYIKLLPSQNKALGIIWQNCFWRGEVGLWMAPGLPWFQMSPGTSETQEHEDWLPRWSSG